MAQHNSGSSQEVLPRLPKVSFPRLPEDTSEPFLERLRPAVENALDHEEGNMDWDYLLRRLRDGTAQWWVAIIDGEPSGVVITEVFELNKTMILRFLVVSGNDFESWYKPGFDCISEWANTIYGATKAEMVGRKGWKRKLIGWRHYSYMVTDIGR